MPVHSSQGPTGTFCSVQESRRGAGQYAVSWGHPTHPVFGLDSPNCSTNEKRWSCKNLWGLQGASPEKDVPQSPAMEQPAQDTDSTSDLRRSTR